MSSTPDFKVSSETAREYETKYSAHNYHPLPVVFQKLRVLMSGILKEKSTWISCLHTLQLTKVTVIQKLLLHWLIKPQS